MRGWKHKVDIHQYLGDESLPQQASAALAIAALSNAKDLFPPPFPLESLVDVMIKAIRAENWERFDSALGLVYDYADEARIWMGL